MQQMVGFMSDLGSRITNVQTSLGLAEDSDETVADLLAALKDQIEQLRLDASSPIHLCRRDSRRRAIYDISAKRQPFVVMAP